MATSLRRIGWVAAMAIAVGGSATVARAQSDAPRPIAADVPTYTAPADPPEDGAPAAPSPVEDAAPLDLATALKLALESNGDLAAMAWGVRSAEARELEESRYRNPRVDFRLYRLNEQDGNRDVARGRVILTQPFELGGKRKHRAEVAGAQQTIAQLDLEIERAELATEVRRRFATVVGAQQRLAALTEWVAFVNGIEELVAANVDRGTMRSLEGHRVRRRAARERADLQAAESDLAAARLRLAALWGNVTPQFTEAVGSLEPSAELPDLQTVLDLATLGPAEARTEAERQRAAAAIDLAKANRTTDLDVGIGARWVEYTNTPDWLIDISLDLPIFNGGKGSVRGAKFDLARVEAGAAAQAAERNTLIAEAYHTLAAVDGRRAALVGDVLPASQELADVYQRAFDAGAASYAELLDARRDLVDARVESIDTMIEFHDALARLEWLVGLALPGFD